MLAAVTLLLPMSQPEGDPDVVGQLGYFLAFAVGTGLLGYGVTLARAGLLGAATVNAANAAVHVYLRASPAGDGVELWWTALNVTLATVVAVACFRLAIRPHSPAQCRHEGTR